MKNFKTKEPVAGPPKASRLGGSVKDYMATNLITFRPDTRILDVINTLVQKKISGAPVLNERNEVVGMVDEKDCLRVLIERSYHNQPVRDGVAADYMDSIMRSISVKSDILDVANIFIETNFKRLLIVDAQGKLVGQISRSDALRAIIDMEK